MIRRLMALFRRSQAFPAPEVSALIARRAQRVSNRDAKTAAAYERIHSILGAGRG